MSQLKRLSERLPPPPPETPAPIAPPPPARDPINLNATINFRRLNFADGFNFGLGFFVAAFIFYVIIVPLSICALVWFSSAIISSLANGL